MLLPELGQRPRRTLPGPGHSAYMSPEQAAGRLDELAPRGRLPAGATSIAC